MLRPVVFVPGLPASHLVADGKIIFPPGLNAFIDREKLAALLRQYEGPDDPDEDDGVTAGPPIETSFTIGNWDFGKEAITLVDQLEALGYAVRDPKQVRFVGWDWRKPVDQRATVAAVRGAIRGLHTSSGKVVLLVHSTGGLVLLGLVKALGDAAASWLSERVAHIVSLGVPWLGTLKSFRAMTLGLSMGLANLFFPKSKAIRVMRKSHGSFDLLPPPPEALAGRGEPLVFQANVGVSPLRATSWCTEAFMRERAAASLIRLGARDSLLKQLEQTGIPITNIVGWGKETDTKATLPSRGRPVIETSRDGDGTIPSTSAGIPGPGLASNVATMWLPLGLYHEGHGFAHGHLWDAPPARELLTPILTDSALPEIFVHAAANLEEVRSPGAEVSIHVVAQDRWGQPLPNATVSFVRPRIALDDRSMPDGRKRIVVARDRLKAGPGAGYMRFVLKVSWKSRGAVQEWVRTFAFPAMA